MAEARFGSMGLMCDEFSSAPKRERRPVLIWVLFAVIFLLIACLVGAVGVVVFAPESEAAHMIWRAVNRMMSNPVGPAHPGE